MYYVFNLSPNQTPSRDMYFLKKLSNLIGDDGFEMNRLLVSLWYIMGLWPIVYSMLLIPSGRSSKSNIPVWPFATLSFFGGVYALIPYFILWRPPPPPVKEDELSSWPLNFLESKLTAGVRTDLIYIGLGLIVYAGLAIDEWKEFYQYFRESKLVHATSLDFTLLSAFAPFWVYNDMTARKCYDKTAWLLPLSIIPFLGPALYLLLRPPLTTMPVSLESTLKSD
uniref:Cardiolipin synthase N-terminal domain-containing protein n=1 Tax=Chenopodium quinoa TaxID=63459 RepID=A0A803MGM5_CHEQI